MQNLNGSAFGGNFSLTKAGLTGLSGAATTISTSPAAGATAHVYANKGAFYTKAPLSTAATPTTDAASASATAASASSGAAFRPLVAQQQINNVGSIVSGSVAAFVFGFDPSGNLRVAQGPVLPYTDTSAQSTAVQMPGLPDWFTPFAYAIIKLVSATSATWTFGTNNWNATGVTIDTPVDVMDIPATPVLTA